MSSPAVQPHSPALRLLAERGYVNQCTDMEGLDGLLGQTQGVPVYVGFDATADSLHVGHLLPIMTLRRLQLLGHKPVILVGGGTTRIGDPSFRTQARPMLDDAQIAANIEGIRQVFTRFLKFGDGPSDAVLVNNADWLDPLRYIDVLRDVGSLFSVNRMLSFDSVRSRLERQENLSFLEFNYMILQACDFLELSQRQGCRVQMGGADQWANIICGVDLVRRKTGAEVYGLTAPLLTTASGAKMGKTASGAVWLNADKLTPFDYWQFWRNCDDADVGRFLRLFTDLDGATIEALDRSDAGSRNAAKLRLANEATALAHGTDAAVAAEAAAAAVFGAAGDASQLPQLQLTASVQDLLDVVVLAGFAQSRSEARRLLDGGGVRVNGEVARDVQLPALPLRLSAGKKRHVQVTA